MPTTSSPTLPGPAHSTALPGTPVGCSPSPTTARSHADPVTIAKPSAPRRRALTGSSKEAPARAGIDTASAISTENDGLEGKGGKPEGSASVGTVLEGGDKAAKIEWENLPLAEALRRTAKGRKTRSCTAAAATEAAEVGLRSKTIDWEDLPLAEALRRTAKGRQTRSRVAAAATTGAVGIGKEAAEVGEGIGGEAWEDLPLAEALRRAVKDRQARSLTTAVATTTAISSSPNGNSTAVQAGAAVSKHPTEPIMSSMFSVACETCAASTASSGSSVAVVSGTGMCSVTTVVANAKPPPATAAATAATSVPSKMAPAEASDGAHEAIFPLPGATGSGETRVSTGAFNDAAVPIATGNAAMSAGSDHVGAVRTRKATTATRVALVPPADDREMREITARDLFLLPTSKKRIAKPSQKCLEAAEARQRLKSMKPEHTRDACDAEHVASSSTWQPRQRKGLPRVTVGGGTPEKEHMLQGGEATTETPSVADAVESLASSEAPPAATGGIERTNETRKRKWGQDEHHRTKTSMARSQCKNSETDDTCACSTHQQTIDTRNGKGERRRASKKTRRREGRPRGGDHHIPSPTASAASAPVGVVDVVKVSAPAATTRFACRAAQKVERFEQNSGETHVTGGYIAANAGVTTVSCGSASADVANSCPVVAAAAAVPSTPAPASSGRFPSSRDAWGWMKLAYQFAVGIDTSSKDVVSEASRKPPGKTSTTDTASIPHKAFATTDNGKRAREEGEGYSTRRAGAISTGADAVEELSGGGRSKAGPTSPVDGVVCGWMTPIGVNQQIIK